MDIRPITDHYAVSPQIVPEDLAALAEAGFTTVICNRPDGEVPHQLQAAAMTQAADAAGITLHALPLTHQTMTPDKVIAQRDIIDEAEGSVLAYCASGTRSSVIWAFGQAGKRSTDEILAQLAKAGYALEQLRPQLDMLAQNPIDSA